MGLLESPCPSVLEFHRAEGGGVVENGGILESPYPSVLEFVSIARGGGWGGGGEWEYTRIAVSACP